MSFQIINSFSNDRVEDLFSCGLEGGIGYWSVIVEKNLGYYDFNKEDWFIKIEVIDDETQHILNREKLQKGLQTMSSKYPYHWKNFLSEDEDASTGDVFIQCCLFDEIVFS